jgi:hypothetical protein
MTTIGERLRLGYVGRLGTGWVKPSVDFDAIQIFTVRF